MKKILSAVTLFAALSMTAFAETETIKGEAVCTKCELHQSAKCGTAIRMADGTIYTAVNNSVAKDFHSTVCKAPAKVEATGEVKDKDGKKTITLTKIEVK
jgi:uncharacterized protein DUF6370